MILEKNRIGRFTSSVIGDLVKFGSVPMTPEELREFKKENPKSGKKNKAAGFSDSGKTLIKKVFAERIMGRSLSTEINTRDTLWGRLMENLIAEVLDVEYEISTTSTVLHRKYGNFWSGTPDAFVERILAAEFKCFKPKNYFALSQALRSKDVLRVRPEFPKEYWQVVSNSIIMGVPYAELVSFMPYKSELKRIIKIVANTDFLKNNKLREGDFLWFNESNIETMAYLPDSSDYPNINRFKFEVPQEDKIFLTKRVLEAEEEVKKLIKQAT